MKTPCEKYVCKWFLMFSSEGNEVFKLSCYYQREDNFDWWKSEDRVFKQMGPA